MIRYILISLWLLFSFFSVQSQSDPLKEKVLSPQEMQEDFATYRQLLEETHPGLYRYQSKEWMQNRMDELAGSLKEPMPFYDFYKKLLALNADIRCAHSYAVPNQNFNRYVSTQISSIPFFIYPIEGRLLVLFNGTLDESIKPGFELLKINGRSSEDIIRELKRHMWSDGYIELGKEQILIGSSFQFSYYSVIEQAEQFELVFADLNGNEVLFNTPAQTARNSNSNYAKNPVNKEVMSFYNKKNKKTWQLKFLKDIPSTATIRMTEFGGKGMYSEDKAQNAIRSFMDKTVAQLQKKKIQNLIIDLRDNPGGWDIIGAELLGYLLPKGKTYRYYDEGFTVTMDSKFLSYADVPKEELEKAKEELIPMGDGTFRLKEEPTLVLHDFTAKDNTYQGNIYFLINQRTGSAAAEFAALAQSHELGTFIGQETYGTYEGSNSTSFLDINLPNSGIKVHTPLVASKLASQAPKKEGRGTFPDYQSDFTREDLLQHHDPQFELAKELIKEKGNKQ